MKARIDSVKGQVEIINMEKQYQEQAVSNTALDISGEYHYYLRSYANSWAVLFFDDEMLYLPPNSIICVTNKDSVKMHNPKGTVRYYVGKAWAWVMDKVGNEEPWDKITGNAVVGIRG